MTNKDREAFETWARSSGVAANDRGCDNFFSETMRIAYHAWQAARDHYAPRLTESEAIEIIRRRGFGPANKVQMLKAAGVLFREEA